MSTPIQLSPKIIYIHNHSKNPRPLNVFDAHIVHNDDGYSNGIIPETKDIALPNHIGLVNEVSIDIGGSLSKLVYFVKSNNNNNNNNNEEGGGGGGRLNFFKIETSKIDEFIEYIKVILDKYYEHDGLLKINSNLILIATGGGSYKYYDMLKKKLNCKIQKEDEMQCLIIGLDFFITEIKNEIFYYDEKNHKYVEIDSTDCEKEGIYPYLLVNIGSGVSMIKVTGSGPDNFVRVGGSSLGGGTLWGLLSVLTKCNDFDEMLELAAQGNNEEVDLLVGDIYGKGYNKIGLKSNHIASSMGKVFKKVFENEDGSVDEDQDQDDCRLDRLNKFKQEDIARSLLYAISNNIGQIAYLQAQRYNLRKIYFAGSYIRNHYQTIRTLSYAIDFWSEGNKKAYFLKHEGYLGSMGAFLKSEFVDEHEHDKMN
ncbi:hypothetical protein CANARDRAFT_174354 [[Candida] arabinofermentans NRRL YB-2248]|uniref:Pantothenate kinase n=1 Tax=[Candida] arabinofermentans NRRL YB-2248 TaxID=983967 RepID=A0A1E4T688_9ASCO|nr:hypothetical protein CANARDRAFT_174354 [[Candida] arabinofermentans NRRL YB-2248]